MSTKYTVMIVDDEEPLCRIISHKLEKEGFRAIIAKHGQDAVDALKNYVVDVVLIDYMLPDMTGIELLQKIKVLQPQTISIMLTAYGNVENAVQAMKMGASDFFSKPIELKYLVESIRAFVLTKRTNGNVKDPSLMTDMVFQSDRMKEIVQMLQRVIETDVNILILGESGVGKTALAKWIHQQSNRASKPFVAINCAAIPESLIESELFGFRKGAFTGAMETRAGMFEAANKGSIFLDEIGEIPLAVQAKLLQVIEEKRFMKIGSSRYEQTDVRILAATNQNIRQRVRDKLFREDLYYRLNVVEVVVPSLRERAADIPLLVQHTLQKLNRKYQKEISISSDACEILTAYSWPGNVRQLVNVMERIHILKSSGCIEKKEIQLPETDQKNRNQGENLFPVFPSESTDTNLQKWLGKVEGKLIQQALAETGGNQTKAAERLGISRHTLIYKLKKQKEIDER